MRLSRWLPTVVAVAAVFLAAGCGPKHADQVEVAIFKGGYGIDFFEKAAREYEASHPGVKFNVWGNPRVWEQLQPRFVQGSPPDLTFGGWGLNHWPLVYEGQLMQLDKFLDEPAADGKTKWRDTLDPSLLRLGQFEGKQYLFPFYFSMSGWWYNPDVFAKHGWKAPRTYSELLALCPKIKAAGIAPITYQGQYPYYMISGFLFPWVISSGGIKALDDAQNLTPGAWKSPAFLKAATMIAELRDKGFFQQGANGMSHTDSQMEFVLGHAAMIPCGTWLHSEERAQLPPNFKMAFFLPPVLDNGPGDPTALCIGIEPWYIPAKCKHLKDAVGYFKYITSLPKAKEFVEAKGTLVATKDCDQANLPDYLKDAAAAYRNAKTIWSSEYPQWYPALGKESENAMAALLAGNATPQQFVDRLEAAAEKARQDKSLKRHLITR
jgi:N-acetylglucosamine transport system substrate-binding protein